MINNIQTTSPTCNRDRISGNNILEALPWCARINLRGNPENADFMDNVTSIIGTPLPLKANTCQLTDNGYTAYWLGPDEWLIHCDLENKDTILQSLKTSLSGIHSAVVDVSDYYTLLKLEGLNASTLLRKACPLDIHPDTFPANACTQTRFGHASILLHKISTTPAYLIQVRWSYTEYVWDYLVSAMRTLPEFEAD